MQYLGRLRDATDREHILVLREDADDIVRHGLTYTSTGYIATLGPALTLIDYAAN
jgi:hypothetical protein